MGALPIVLKQYLLLTFEMDYALIPVPKVAVIHTFIIASAKFLEHR
jgi:hypothetical protein